MPTELVLYSACQKEGKAIAQIRRRYSSRWAGPPSQMLDDAASAETDLSFPRCNRKPRHAAVRDVSSLRKRLASNPANLDSTQTVPPGTVPSDLDPRL